MDIPYIVIGVAALAVILLVLGVMVWKGKGSFAPDYRGWFYIGLIWLPIGVLMALTLDNPGYWFFAVMGLVFVALGWKNRDKWNDRPKFADLTSGAEAAQARADWGAVGAAAGRVVSLCVFREPGSGDLTSICQAKPPWSGCRI